MGAETFVTTGKGPTLERAFHNALETACWDHGHAGYSGTLAEKTEFIEISLPEGKDPYQYAEELIAAADPRINDKWGPAGAFKVPDEENTWLFFGWASS